MKKIKKKILKKRETFSQTVKKSEHSLPQKPRIHSQERRLSNRRLTKLKIENHQHHSTKNSFKTGGRTSVQTGWGSWGYHWGSAEKKALNAKRHEVLLHTFPHSRSNSPSLHILISLFHPVCTNCLHCLLYGWLTLVISHFDFFALLLCLLCY